MKTSASLKSWLKNCSTTDSVLLGSLYLSSKCIASSGLYQIAGQTGISQEISLEISIEISVEISLEISIEISLEISIEISIETHRTDFITIIGRKM